MEWQTVIDFCVDNEKVIGTVAAFATAVATFATAGALYFSARAAKASRDSADVALSTLEYSQRISLREAFESRYSLLLEQHNLHLKNVCGYLDSKDNVLFMQSVANTKFVEDACKKLMGHAVISPYMRILYHLLKHIDDNYYEDDLDNTTLNKKKKEYTSPLRSLIRNDVLYLIALNSIITKTNLDGIKSDNGYARYQKLLHDFDFFEHAIFYDWRESLPNGIQFSKIEKNFDKYYFDPIQQRCSDSIYLNEFFIDKYIGALHITKPSVLFSLIYTYKNPTYHFAHNLFDNFETKLTSIIGKELENCQSNKEKEWNFLKRLKGTFIGFHSDSRLPRSLIKSISEIKRIIYAYKMSAGKNFDYPNGIAIFYYNNRDENYYTMGETVASQIKSYIYNNSLLDLKNSPDKDEKITSLVSFAVKKVNEQRERLEQLRYDAP